MTSTSPAQGGPSHSDEPEIDDNKSVSSDGENTKVREKLKKTSIATGKAGNSNNTQEGNSDGEDSPSDESMISSPTSASAPRSRKRSRDLEEQDEEPEDITEEVLDQNGNKVVRPAHRRKRSRDRDLDLEKNGEASKDARPATPKRENKEESDEELPDARLTSPRTAIKKRGREDLETEEDMESVDAAAADEETTEEKGVTSRPMSRNFTEEHAKKRLRESPEAEGKKSESPKSDSEKKAETKLPPGSGFANTSASSPFAAAGNSGKSIFGSGASKPPLAKDLFSSSKFGALSGSSASPFASAAPSASPFASAKSNASPFATAGGASPFASLGTKPLWGTGTSMGMTFGKSETPKPFSSGTNKKPAKPFGAPDTDNEEEDSGDSGDEGEEDKDEDKVKKDEHEKKLKLVEQEVSTGEEGEDTVFQFRGKIFVFDKETKSWKERGMGNIRLKSSIPDENDLAEDKTPKRRVRLIARTDATYKVILNIPLSKDLMSLYGDKGKEPSGTVYNLVGSEDGVNKQFIVKTKLAKDLHEHIVETLNH